MAGKKISLQEANQIIKAQATRIKELEEENIAFPFRLYYALEAILDHDPVYQLVPPNEISLFDFQFEMNRRVKLLPKDIICILSEEGSRKKTIYTLEENLEGKRELNRYSFNKAGDLETWARFFDKLAYRLIKVSKSTIANVAFYQLANDHCLHLRMKLPKLPQVETIKISEKKSVYETFKKDFIKVQEAYRNHILLQKKVLGYMNLIDAIVEGKFAP